MKTEAQIRERIEELEMKIEALRNIKRTRPVRLWTEGECFDYDKAQNCKSALQWVLENKESK